MADEYSAEQFNKYMPVGTEVIWFPRGDELPIVTTKIAEPAVQLPCNRYPTVILEASKNRVGGPMVPCHNVYKVSHEQLDQLFRILDARE